MKRNSLEIKDRKAELQKRCKAIIKTCREEIREMTAEEKEEIENAKQEIEALKEELKALNKRLADFDEMEKELEEASNDEEEEVEVVEEEIENKEEEIKSKKSNIRNMMKKEKFSLIKAINDVVNNRNFDAKTQSVINAGANEMRKCGVNFTGQIQLPVEKRDITVATEHDNVVGLEVMPIEEALRAKNVLVNAGAKYLTNLVGDVLIPTMNGSQVGWEGEISEAKDGNVSFNSIKLSPKRLTAFVDVSKALLNQSSEAVEEMLKNDLISAINSKLEQTILGEIEGTTERPAGIFYGKTIDSATTTFAQLTALESSVEDANTLGKPCYVMSNSSKGAFRAMSKSTKNTQLVMEAGEIDGVAVHNTSNVPANKFIFGDFSNLAIGQWAGIDVVVDPFSQAKNGMVRLVVNAYFDAKVMRDEAFAVGKTA